MKIKVVINFTCESDPGVVVEAYTIADFDRQAIISRIGPTAKLPMRDPIVQVYDDEGTALVMGFEAIDPYNLLVVAPMIVSPATPKKLDRLTFDLMCLAEARQQSTKLTRPADPVQMKAFRRENYRRNMLKGHAKKLMNNPELKKRICAGLKAVRDDLLSVVRALLAVFAGGTLMGVTVTPAVLAALAVMITKFGIAYFCEV